MPTAPPGGHGTSPGDEGGLLDATVVIPAYNEAARIAAPLRRLGAYLREHHPRREPVLTGDGSSDDTAGTDVREHAPWVNRLLINTYRLETAALKLLPRLPPGLGIAALAERAS
jgi:hypothetical protein